MAASVVSTAMLLRHLAGRITRPMYSLMRRLCCIDIPEGPSRPQGDNLDGANCAIAGSEEHYRMVWNHSLHLGILVDSNGIIRDLNRRGEIKFWRSAARLLGTPVYSLFRPEDQLRLYDLLAEAFASGKERPAGEWSVPAPTGDFFVMEVDLVPLRKDGMVEMVMLQLTDWTEKKLLQDRLLRSERLASLSQFASMFAHDIRNPLAGVKKTLELMGQRVELQTDPVRRWCEDLQFTIEQLQGMINDMLDVYQEHYSCLPLMTSSVCLNDLVHEVLHLFRLEAESREITFNLRLPDDRLMLEGDRRRLERVLSNLVHNALKFSPRRGLVTVSAWSECGENPADGAGNAAETGDRISISIEDEGPGIDLDVLPHIFEMFFRPQGGQDWRTGRGLGLYFCRLVVEGHHGSIRAANRDNGGARFQVELPAGKSSHVHHLAHC
ncbi:MAG TPA: PAS domain-containing sensor histidine kinase [Nitrospira sp.]|nr:PAS domain-containing sensor histidine kinase [Nitrospira sp.]